MKRAEALAEIQQPEYPAGHLRPHNLEGMVPRHLGRAFETPV